MTQMDSVFKSDVCNKNTPSRAFHAYCIGTQKSGTHSIAGLFQPLYKAAHEPEHYELFQLLLATQTMNQAILCTVIICALMAQYFPEVRDMNDALGSVKAY